ncbi:elongation factor P [Bacteroidota bacterium]
MIFAKKDFSIILSLQQIKNIFMATTADFKNGLCIDFNGKPCSIVWFQHVKPGKGGAFVKVKMRNLENGRILENTYNAGEKIEIISVERRPYQFLYKDDMGYNFMHNETYEQINLGADLVDNADLMKEGQYVEMMFLADQERVLTCELPPFVEMEITYTEPAVKGDTASTNAMKSATIETGAEIMVPLFINQGERIKVDTRTRSYAERCKN